MTKRDLISSSFLRVDRSERNVNTLFTVKKFITTLLLFYSVNTFGIGIEILGNEEINSKYGISVELTEKSTRACNDFIIYAPLELRLKDFGSRALGKIESNLYQNKPSVKDVISTIEFKAYEYEVVDNQARVFGCVKKSHVDKIYFNFHYHHQDAPPVVLVAPLF